MICGSMFIPETKCWKNTNVMTSSYSQGQTRLLKVWKYPVFSFFILILVYDLENVKVTVLHFSIKNNCPDDVKHIAKWIHFDN